MNFWWTLFNLLHHTLTSPLTSRPQTCQLSSRNPLPPFFFFSFLNFFIQEALISCPFYTHQCIHVNPNLPIPPTTTTTPRHFPPLVSIRLFSTFVSQFLPCKPVHLYHFSRFHICVLIYDIFLFLTYFTLYDSL